MNGAHTGIGYATSAKEGRRYGVSLGLISQRPSELEPSVVSQCGTLFAPRMNNTVNQTVVEAAMNYRTAATPLSPSLGPGKQGSPLSFSMRWIVGGGKSASDHPNLRTTESGYL